MYCSNCGNQIERNEKVCSKCGKAVLKEAHSEIDKNVITSKKIKTIVFIIAIMLSIIVCLNLMNKNPEEPLVGTWICTTDEEWILTFKEDGTFYDSDSYFLYYTDVGTWNIPSDGIIYFDCVGDNATLDYELTENTLTIYVTGSVNPSYSFRKK